MRVLLYFTILPLAVSFLTAIFGRRIKRFSDIAAVLSTLGLFLFSLYILSLVNHKGILVYKIGGWGHNLGICLVADGFASLMLSLIHI